MNKILIAVDNTKGTKEMFEKTLEICKRINPETIILVYVEKFEGSSLMDDMLGDAELSELKKELKGTDIKKALDKKADSILNYYKKAFQSTHSFPEIKTVVRTGHPAEEIIKASQDESADMIIIGTRGKRVGHFFIGSVSREVVNKASVSVLLVK